MSQENFQTPMMNIISGMQFVNEKPEVKNKTKGTCLCGKETPSPAEACCTEHADLYKYPDLSIIKYKIESYRQNFPELVIRDAQEYLELTDKQCDTLRNILLARGVNKWLKVRKDLVTYKTTIKKEITRLCNALHDARIELKNYPKLTRSEMSCEQFKKWKNISKKRVEMKYRLKCLNEVQKELNKMCHSPRYVIWRNSEVVSVEKSGVVERCCRVCNRKNMVTKRHCKTCAEIARSKWERAQGPDEGIDGGKAR